MIRVFQKSIRLLGIILIAAAIPALAQQPARPLTPAEQRQKEKIEQEIQRERAIKAKWLQKQQAYEARQAEKERQRQAREAAKNTPAPKPEHPGGVPRPPQTPTAAPASAGKPERLPKPKKINEPKAETAPAAVPADTLAPTTPPNPIPSDAAPKEPRQRKREKTPEPTYRPEAPSAPTVERRAEHQFLPTGHLFEPILLDPLQAQTYGSLLPVFVIDGHRYKGSIVPFAFGTSLPLYRRTVAPGHANEFVLEVGSFTQFEVYFDEVKRRQRRQLINTDYKLSFQYNLLRGANTYRFRLYHLSSHLGDDYLFRNHITVPTPNPVNYEVADLTYSHQFRDLRVYGGLGFGLRVPAERKRLSAQVGVYYRKLGTRNTRLVGGADVKFWQQTNFRPGIHAGIGAEVGPSERHNLTFLLETYSGFRPYSQLEQQQVFWLGVGMYLRLF